MNISRGKCLEPVTILHLYLIVERRENGKIGQNVSAVELSSNFHVEHYVL